MAKYEILAPVGGADQLLAAVRCSADAVYTGIPGFNARQSANNFTEEELARATDYCHTSGVKLYGAMNTLLTDDELDGAVTWLRRLCEIGIDGIIVQDLALASIAQRCCPDLRLHASTQMTIHNLEGARALESLGFKRCVLARELSLDEISYIAKNTNIELEVFVHGALCASVSGTCLMSSMLGGRSGNRGRCAQPCRLNFTNTNREYALSLKDMSHVKYIQDLIAAGVYAFKIEGRMKRPEYTAAAVRACRESAEGRKYDENALRAVFSRSGFTDGYIKGVRNYDMFGTRTRDDVTAAAPVLKEISRSYEKETPRIPVDIDFFADENGSKAKISDGVNSFSVTGDTPTHSETNCLCPVLAQRSFAKCGGTPYFLRELKTDIDENLFMSSSQLNAMRRALLDGLTVLRSSPSPIKFSDTDISSIPPEQNFTAAAQKKPKIRLRFENAAQVFPTPDADAVILPVGEIARKPDVLETAEASVFAEIPQLVFPENAENIIRKIDMVLELGVKQFYCGNIGFADYLARRGMTVHGDFGLNILNSVSLAEYKKILADAVISPELQLDRIKSLRRSLPIGIISYGNLPLMNFRACPSRGVNGCGECDGHPTVTDRKNITFPLLCREKQYTTLLNSVPLYMPLCELTGIDFAVIYFTTESISESKKIYKRIINGESPGGKITSGLYKRRLL